MDSSFNCLECGAVVQGNGPHQERGFCCESCMEVWNEWMIQQEIRDIPGLSDVFTDGGYPTLEQALQYCMIALGCLVSIFVDEPGTFTIAGCFEWGCSDHSFFLGNSAKAFMGIDGFTLNGREKVFVDPDGEENIGLRRIELRKTGNDLTRVCLDLIVEVLARKKRFDRECDKWAKSHAVELRRAAERYMTSTRVRTLNGVPIAHAHEEFIRWLDPMGEGERRWA